MIIKKKHAPMCKYKTQSGEVIDVCTAGSFPLTLEVIDSKKGVLKCTRVPLSYYSADLITDSLSTGK